MAIANSRWCEAQRNDLRRGMIFMLEDMNRRSVSGSL